MKGVIGVFSKTNATQKAINILYGVQHRGQESAGISTTSGKSIRTWNEKGLVSKLLQGHFNSFIHPNDYIVIGCASGENTNHGNLPPIELTSMNYSISIAYDGFLTNTDSHIGEKKLGKIMLENIESRGIKNGLINAIQCFPQGYTSMVAIICDKQNETSYLAIYRDQFGVRPLFIGHNDDEFYVASESAPFDVLESMGTELHERRDCPPGSLILFSEEKFQEIPIHDPNPAHCAFEWVYFGRPDSIIEGIPVHIVRKKLGHLLVETHSLDKQYQKDIEKSKKVSIIPVPDSGRSVSVGVAEAIGTTADEGIIKNAYLGRTYIIDDPEYRKIASDLKHNIIKDTVKNKKVLITDDSIVRGTVSESVAKNLLKAGAKEVEILVSYAPIFYPCFSDPKDKPLAASKYEGKNINEIGNKVAENLPSINKVHFNTIENVHEAIGLPKNHVCSFCASGINLLKD